jgi:ABC-type transport system substrate-binding protein
VRRSQFLAAAAASAASPSLRRTVLRLDVVPSGHDVDPYRDPEFGISEIAWLYADGLMGWSDGPVPLLAENFPEVLDGGLRHRYKLRDSRWHDGKPVTSDDVAQAVDAVKNGVHPAGSQAAAHYWSTVEPYRSIQMVTVRSRKSFDVVLDKPMRSFARTFFSAYGRDALPLLRSSVDALPIGTGPFALRARLDLNRWRLERAETSRRGRPRLDAIDLRYLYDSQFDVAPLKRGETHVVIPLPGRTPVDPAYRRIARVTGTALLIFNASGTFRDVELRRSFAKMINVPLLQRRYDPGQRSFLASFLVAGANDAALERSLQPDEAASATLRAGLRGSSVRIVTVPRGTAFQVADSVRDLLTKADMRAELVIAQYAGLFGPNSPLRRGEFDLAVNSYIYGDEADLAADWGCAEQPPQGGNFARYCDPTFEAAVAAGNTTAALRRLYDQLVAIPLSRAHEDIGVGPAVCEFPAPPLLVPATLSCARWRLC